ncbi:MAG TPA: hypothetical protein VJL29_06925, partial [Thermoguttaceae bacterium]|nr:hypothetical protein [Thermoguttaceae bacterium]
MSKKRTTTPPSATVRRNGRTDEDGLPRVAVVVETSHSYGREIFRGITRYIRENNPWSVFFVERSLCDGVPKWLRKWSGHGIITRVSTPDIAEFMAHRNIPVVDLNQQLGGLGVPQITNDHAAIGRLGAEHLLQRGFQHFGFVGHDGMSWSDGRRDAFLQVVTEAGG